MSDIQEILNNPEKFNEVAKSVFDGVDTDGSGQIDAQELENAMNQIASDIGTDPPSKENVAEVLKHLDTDGSGKISFIEFKALVKLILEAMI
jgi:Ca2+-binding EF-hand superfamily protein